MRGQENTDDEEPDEEHWKGRIRTHFDTQDDDPNCKQYHRSSQQYVVKDSCDHWQLRVFVYMLKQIPLKKEYVDAKYVGILRTLRVIWSTMPAIKPSTTTAMPNPTSLFDSAEYATVYATILNWILLDL